MRTTSANLTFSRIVSFDPMSCSWSHKDFPATLCHLQVLDAPRVVLETISGLGCAPEEVKLRETLLRFGDKACQALKSNRPTYQARGEKRVKSRSYVERATAKREKRRWTEKGVFRKGIVEIAIALADQEDEGAECQLLDVSSLEAVPEI